MSDAVASVGTSALVGATRPSGLGELPGHRDPPPAPPPALPNLPKTEADNQRALMKQGSYRVNIDAHTLRVIAEVVNPATGDVMFYLPPGYRPDAPRAEPVADKGADSESAT